MLFRQTNDNDLLRIVGTTINETIMMDFSPTLLLIVTWDRIPVELFFRAVCIILTIELLFNIVKGL